MEITLLHLTALLAAFLSMEAVAWFTHSYVMHGPLWVLHKDHHKYLRKEDAASFGLLWMPYQYYQEQKSK